MNTIDQSTLETGSNGARPEFENNLVAKAQKSLSQLIKSADDCDIFEREAYISVAVALLCRRDEVDDLMEERQVRDDFSGQFQIAKRAMYGMSDFDKLTFNGSDIRLARLKKVVGARLDYVARQTTYILHAASKESKELQSDWRSNAAAFQEYAASIVLTDAKTAFDADQKSGEGSADPEGEQNRRSEFMRNMLSSRKEIASVDLGRFIGAEGDIGIALFEVTDPSTARIKAALQADRIPGIEKIVESLRGGPVNKDNLAAEAIADALTVRQRHFSTLLTNEPADKRKPHGKKREAPPQVLVAAMGEVIWICYGVPEAQPTMMLKPTEKLVGELNAAGLLFQQQLKGCSEYIGPLYRSALAISTDAPTTSDKWLMRYRLSSPAISGVQAVSIHGLKDHRVKPTIPMYQTYAPVASLGFDEEELHRFFTNIITQLVDEKGANAIANLEFTKKGLGIRAKRQPLEMAPASAAPQIEKVAKVKFRAKSLLTLIDATLDIIRGGTATISTDGDGLVRIATMTQIGEYEFYLPTVSEKTGAENNIGYQSAKIAYS